MSLNPSFLHRYTTTFPEIPSSLINDAICHLPPSHGIRLNSNAMQSRRIVHHDPLPWPSIDNVSSNHQDFHFQHFDIQSPYKKTPTAAINFVNSSIISNATISAFASLQQVYHHNNTVSTSSLQSLKELSSLGAEPSTFSFPSTPFSSTSTSLPTPKSTKVSSKQDKKAQLQERRRIKVEKLQQKKKNRLLEDTPNNNNNNNNDDDINGSEHADDELHNQIDTDLYRSSLVSAMPWNPQSGFFVQPKINYHLDPLYHLSGLYYSQDPSSQLLHSALSQTLAYSYQSSSLSHDQSLHPLTHSLSPSQNQLAAQHKFDTDFLSINNNSPLQLLDLCSSPGGKTLLIADLFSPLQRQSLLISNEFDSIRAQTLIENILRSGIINNIVTLSSGQSLSTIFNTPLAPLLNNTIFIPPSTPLAPTMTSFPLFNHVLLDAPCSSSGMMRKQPSIAKQWSRARIPAIVQVQRELLQSASQLLSPHHITNNIIYMTCAMEIDENTRNIVHFLDTMNRKITKLYAQFFDPSRDLEKAQKLQSQINTASSSVFEKQPDLHASLKDINTSAAHSHINTPAAHLHINTPAAHSHTPLSTYPVFKSILSPFHSHFKRWNLYQHQQTDTTSSHNLFAPIQYEYHKLLQKMQLHKIPFTSHAAQLSTSNVIEQYSNLSTLYKSITTQSPHQSKLDLTKEEAWFSESSYAACFVTPYTTPLSIPSRFDQLGEGMFISVLKRVNFKEIIKSTIQTRFLARLTSKYDKIQKHRQLVQNNTEHKNIDLSAQSQNISTLFQDSNNSIHPSYFSTTSASSPTNELQFKHIGELTTGTQYSFIPQEVQRQLFNTWLDEVHFDNNNYILLARNPRFVTPQVGFVNFHQQNSLHNNADENKPTSDAQHVFSEIILLPRSQLRTLFLLDSIDSYYKELQSQESNNESNNDKKWKSSRSNLAPDQNSSQRSLVPKSKHLVQHAGLPLGFISLGLNAIRDFAQDNDFSTILPASHINTLLFKPSHFLAVTPSLLNQSKRTHMYQADHPTALSLLTTKPYLTTINSIDDAAIIDHLIPSSLQNEIQTQSTYNNQPIQVITHNPPSWMNPELNLLSLHLLKSLLQIQYFTVNKRYKSLSKSLNKLQLTRSDNLDNLDSLDQVEKNQTKLAMLHQLLVNIPHLVANLVVLQDHMSETSYPITTTVYMRKTPVQVGSIKELQSNLEQLTSLHWRPFVRHFLNTMDVSLGAVENDASQNDVCVDIITNKYTKYILQKHKDLCSATNTTNNNDDDNALSSQDASKMRLMQPRCTITLEDCVQFAEMKQLMVHLLSSFTADSSSTSDLMSTSNIIRFHHSAANVDENKSHILHQNIEHMFKRISANTIIPLTSISPLPLPFNITISAPIHTEGDKVNALPPGLRTDHVLGHIYPTWQDAYLQTHYHLDNSSSTSSMFTKNSSLRSLIQPDGNADQYSDSDTENANSRNFSHKDNVNANANANTNAVQHDDNDDNDEYDDKDVDNVDNVDNKNKVSKPTHSSTMIAPNNLDNYGAFEQLYSKFPKLPKLANPNHLTTSTHLSNSLFRSHNTTHTHAHTHPPICITPCVSNDGTVWNLTRPTITVPHDILADIQTLTTTTSIPHLFPIITPYSNRHIDIDIDTVSIDDVDDDLTHPKEIQARQMLRKHVSKNMSNKTTSVHQQSWGDRSPSFFPTVKSSTFSYSVVAAPSSTSSHRPSKYTLLTFQNYAIGWLFDATAHNTEHIHSTLLSSSSSSSPLSSSKKPLPKRHATSAHAHTDADGVTSRKIPLIPRSWGLFAPKVSSCLSSVIQRGHFSPSMSLRGGSGSSPNPNPSPSRHQSHRQFAQSTQQCSFSTHHSRNNNIKRENSHNKRLQKQPKYHA